MWEVSQALAHTCLSNSKSHPHLFTGGVHILGLDEVLWQRVSQWQQRLGKGEGEAVVERALTGSQETCSVICGKSSPLSGRSFLTRSGLESRFYIQFYGFGTLRCSAAGRKPYQKHLPPVYLPYESRLVWVTEQKRNIQWHRLELVSQNLILNFRTGESLSAHLIQTSHFMETETEHGVFKDFALIPGFFSKVITLQSHLIT